MNFAQQPQQQFGVQILARLVDDCDVLGDRNGDARGQYLAAFQRSHYGWNSRPGQLLQRLSPLGGKLACSIGELVSGGSRAGDCDAVPSERIDKGRRRELRRILHRQRRMEALGGRRSPDARDHRAGPPFQSGVGSLALGRNRHGVVQRVVVHFWGPLGGGCAGHGRVCRHCHFRGIFVKAQR